MNLIHEGIELVSGGRNRDPCFYTENDFSMAVYGQLGPRMLRDRGACEDGLVGPHQYDLAPRRLRLPLQLPIRRRLDRVDS